jgi:transcriptional regulator with XRE-family HTH domain
MSSQKMEGREKMMGIPSTTAVVSEAMEDHPLVRWRAKYQVTQEELAQRCQLSQQAISAYESGDRLPRGTSVWKLMQATDLPLEALLFPERFLQDHPHFLREPLQRRIDARKRPSTES